MIGAKDKSLHLIYSVIILAVFVWSLLGPVDFKMWFSNASIVIVAFIIMAWVYPKFKFTKLVYTLAFVAFLILLIAAHYTFSQQPTFNWLRQVFHFNRNHFDRFGHFFQGPTVAFIVRELMVRKSPLKGGKWLYFISLCVSMAAGTVNEFIEWGAAAYRHQGMNSPYIDAQGDLWDAQWDMFMSFIGANITLLLLSKYHDRLLKD